MSWTDYFQTKVVTEFASNGTVLNRESRQVWIGFPVIVAVEFRRIIARSDADAANA